MARAGWFRRGSTAMAPVAAAALLAMAGSAAAAADPAAGEWLNQNGSGKVALAPCAAAAEKLCGSVTWLKDPSKTKDVNNPDPNLRSRPLVGMMVIRDMKNVGPGRWSGGKLYDPETGKTYDGKLRVLDSGKLRVDGCVLMICQAQTWTRAG